jgi:UDP-2,3-diacylglucosamine pyrophosphatase LpxH
MEHHAYRTIFLSDLHLGGKCNYSGLLNFLDHNNAETWYLVGDILDFWAINRTKFWSSEATAILQKFLLKARCGQRLVVLPGNHDPELRHLEGFMLDNIEVVERATFTTADGATFTVLHGDVFDAVIGHAKWLAKIGAVVYDWLVDLNMLLNWFRRLFGMDYWSFSAIIKEAVKSTVSYVSDFEESIAELARQDGTDGVICGHIHTPCKKYIGDVLYINIGDWVESLTAVVEHEDGRMELMRYSH